mmetsp:Transcript_94049/g.184416  ORF Transcript_94049/g.184416 Transcript_94049/m.184416 type:complete len:225 (-) Transcript_94049:10-684(-)
MAARGDAEHGGQTEIPCGQALLERGDEATRGRVNMDANLPTLLLVQFLQHLVDIPHWVVLTTIMVAHDAHYADRLLVNLLLDCLGRDGKSVLRRYHELWLDVHVAEKLLPSRLEARGYHQVRVDGANLVLRHVVALRIPLAPAELQAQTAQQACFCGADGPSTRVCTIIIEIRGLRAMPELRHHVQDDIVHPKALRVHSLVRQVDPHAKCRRFDFLVLENHIHI